MTFFEREFLLNDSKEVVVSDLLLLNCLIAKHPDPKELVSCLLFPLVEKSFHSYRDISFLSLSLLHNLANANNLISSVELVKSNKNTVFGSLSLNFHYKSDAFTRNCAILLNLIKMMQQNGIGMFEDSILFLRESLRTLDFDHPDSEAQCCCILRVFEEFLKVYSIDYHDSSNNSSKLSFIQQTTLDLLRTSNSKHVEWKKNSFVFACEVSIWEPRRFTST